MRATVLNGRRSPAPKTRLDSTLTKTSASLLPPSRIFEGVAREGIGNTCGPGFAELVIGPAHRVRLEPAIGPARGRTRGAGPVAGSGPARWLNPGPSICVPGPPGRYRATEKAIPP